MRFRSLIRWLPVLLILALTSCDSAPLPVLGEEVPISDVIDGAITVERNPSGRVPLSAQFDLATVEPVRISWTVLGDEPLEYSQTWFSRTHSVPVLGLYPDTTNQVQVRLDLINGDWALDTLHVATRALPEHFPDVEVTVMGGPREPGWFQSHVSFGLGGRYGTTPLAYDENGVIRWYLELTDLGGMAFMLEQLANGNFITGFREDIFEYDAMGNEVNTWHMPGNLYHHDVHEKPDGNLIVAVDVEAWSTIEDAAIELDRATGAIVNSWDLRPVLDVDRRTLTGSDTDWFHMNSVWFDPRDNGVIFSGRNQGVVKVTYDNELVWILSPHAGWEGTNARGQNLQDFLLTAVDGSGTPYADAVQQGHDRAPDFDWSWGQHAAMTTDAPGRLLLFDNGFNRQFGLNDFYSRAVEYDIDESAMTIRQVWQYGRERGRETYSAIISDVDVLPETGNRLYMPGIIFDPPNHAWVTEVTYPSGNTVMEAKLTLKNQFGSGAFAWGEFDLVYRSDKVNLPDLLPAR